jgi:hypothetical protein
LTQGTWLSLNAAAPPVKGRYPRRRLAALLAVRFRRRLLRIARARRKGRSPPPTDNFGLGDRRSVVGHEERFLPTRLSAGCGFRKETIAGMRRNGRDAPKAAARGTAIEPRGSIRSRLWRRVRDRLWRRPMAGVTASREMLADIPVLARFWSNPTATPGQRRQNLLWSAASHPIGEPG